MGTRNTYYRINLPRVAGKVRASPLSVLPKSSKILRQHVERFALYFLREMDTGGVQFEAAETENSPGYVPYRAYLFHDGVVYFGATCFRYREWEDISPCWSLDWVWLHPYFRSRKHLTQAWSEFKLELGDFVVQKPLSPAMTRFLDKIDQQNLNK